jgi:hypothetical protein
LYTIVHDLLRALIARKSRVFSMRRVRPRLHPTELRMRLIRISFRCR